MSGTTTRATKVTPEEEERRIEEFRRQGFEKHAMPHIIYHGSAVACPWPGCSIVIAGVDFQLEKMSDKTRYTQLLTAWWQGPGLVGRCPGCGQYVLFSMNGKQAVPDPNIAGTALLPDDWHQTAYIL
ncbi:MAG TPA: hypothetical protein VG099_13700 [Gemmataceae bacterium]|jgi:hypothetical protein|nr:hypothetical protein [Gemmataceae bacterium]